MASNEGVDVTHTEKQAIHRALRRLLSASFDPNEWSWEGLTAEERAAIGDEATFNLLVKWHAE